MRPPRSSHPSREGGARRVLLCTYSGSREPAKRTSTCNVGDRLNQSFSASRFFSPRDAGRREQNAGSIPAASIGGSIGRFSPRARNCGWCGRLPWQAVWSARQGRQMVLSSCRWYSSTSRVAPTPGAGVVSVWSRTVSPTGTVTLAFPAAGRSHMAIRGTQAYLVAWHGTAAAARGACACDPHLLRVRPGDL